MSIEVKQKIKEVADDFAMPAKKLIEIVGKFYEKPKSSSQNLTEDQLNVIFDYITQQNQIDSIEQVFAAAAAKKETPAPAPAPTQQAKPAAPAQSSQNGNQPRPQGGYIVGQRRLVQFYPRSAADLLITSTFSAARATSS